MTDIRWRQRFRNFDRAFGLVQSPLASKPLDAFSDLEQEGIIQRFAYTYELAWKTIKNFLEERGVVISPVTPRNVIKEACAAKLVDDGQARIDMMRHRNLLSHAYDFSKFKKKLKTPEDITDMMNRVIAAYSSAEPVFPCDPRAELPRKKEISAIVAFMPPPGVSAYTTGPAPF